MLDIPVLLNQGRPIQVNIAWLQTRCWVERGIYRATNQPYIHLIDRQRKVLCSATVPVIGCVLDTNQCLIRDESESFGIKKTLVDAGIVELTGETYTLDSSTFYVARIME